MSDEIKLKPCPFCKEEARFIEPEEMCYAVECTNKMCMASSKMMCSNGEAVSDLLAEAWNMRDGKIDDPDGLDDDETRTQQCYACKGRGYDYGQDCGCGDGKTTTEVRLKQLESAIKDIEYSAQASVDRLMESQRTELHARKQLVAIAKLAESIVRATCPNQKGHSKRGAAMEALGLAFDIINVIEGKGPA